MFYKVVFNPKKGVSYPEYATKGSSGCDLKAFIDEDIVIPPLGRKLISTGLFIEMSEDTEAQIRPGSGLALKHGITVLNTPGTIDSKIN